MSASRSKKQRTIFGDPSIWGEEPAEPPGSSTAASSTSPPAPLQHSPDIRLLELKYGADQNTADATTRMFQEVWKVDVRRLQYEIFPVRYGRDFYSKLSRWNYKVVVAVDFARVRTFVRHRLVLLGSRTLSHASRAPHVSPSVFFLGLASVCLSVSLSVLCRLILAQHPALWPRAVPC